MRRVKNVAADDDWDEDGWDDDGWGGGGSWAGTKKSAPKPKPAAKKAAAKPAAGKAVAKATAAAGSKPVDLDSYKAAKPAAKSAEACKPASSTTAAADKAPAAKDKAHDRYVALRVHPANGAGLELVWLEGQGYQIDEIDESPGQPGLKVGDVIRAIDGARLDTAKSEDEVEDLFGSKFGDGVQLEIDRKVPEKKEGGAKEEPKEGDLEFSPPSRKEEPKKAEPKEEEVEPAPPVAAEADGKPCISLVVVGHVDAGKSTMMGHLLCLVGEISSKVIHKFEKESKQMNKASFAYAWVLDEGTDERERGVTIDVCVKHFSTKNKRFTILDAPGHRDFVPNMLQGAVQADVAMLVADVSHFEAGFDRGGQTREHLQLVRSLGISHVVVAVNKLDTADWDQLVFEKIKGRLHSFITGPECGFKESNVSYVPVSGFTGENMIELKEPKLKKWYDGPTLLDTLDALPAIPRPDPSGPLRIPISDLYKSGSNAVASGKVEAGKITHGQKLLLLPSNEQTTAKSLMSHNVLSRSNVAGDYLDCITMPIELQFANIGGVITDINHPVPVVDTFQAKIMVFDVDIPIMKGQQFMCYLHVETLRCTLLRLEQLIIKGKPQDKRPKCLQKGNTAIVQLRVDHKICLEPAPTDGVMTSLSRLVLRDKGRTVAAGAVVGVL